ncbi:small GTPase-binding protein [Flagelloscypha sp. PMI_526]|nr:small GTPase-binding protein [Flagelloscypha sp. PMI_526]
MKPIRRQLVIVGDDGTGKTALLVRFVQRDFLGKWVPSLFEYYMADIGVDGQAVEMVLLDTAGQESFDSLRPLNYHNTQVVLITFSLCCPESLDHVQTRWINELKKFIPKIPIILVGWKKDTRNDKSVLDRMAGDHALPISSDEGMVLALKIGAALYLECSSKLGEGVDEVFIEATRLALGVPVPILRRLSEVWESSCVVC